MYNLKPVACLPRNPFFPSNIFKLNVEGQEMPSKMTKCRAGLRHLGSQMVQSCKTLCHLGSQIHSCRAAFSNLGSQIYSCRAVLCHLGSQIHRGRTASMDLGSPFSKQHFFKELSGSHSFYNRLLLEELKCNLRLFFNLSIKDMNDTYLNLITILDKVIRSSLIPIILY